MKFFTSVPKSACSLIILLSVILFTSSSAGNSDANSVISDLQSAKRIIFAVATVNSKLTLLISGQDKTSVDGCLAEVEEPLNGVFKITKVEPLPSGIPNDAPIKFACIDTFGSKLVTMSSKSIGAVTLPSGSFEPTAIKDDKNIGYCINSGNIYLPSSDSLYYFTIDASGDLKKYFFHGKEIKTSDTCSLDGNYDFLCITGAKITVSAPCQGKPISGLTSGFVGGSSTYLFDGSNTVYVFASIAIDRKETVNLKKVTSKDAWTLGVNPNSDNPSNKKDNPSGKSSGPTVLIIMILVTMLICCVMAIITGVTCYKDPYWVRIRAFCGCGKGKDFIGGKASESKDKDIGKRKASSSRSKRKQRHSKNKIGHGGSSSKLVKHSSSRNRKLSRKASKSKH